MDNFHFDPELESIIPAEVAGHAPDFVLSYRQIAAACLTPSVAQQFVDALPSGWDIGAISTANAGFFNFPENPNLFATRYPGHQAELARSAAYVFLAVDPANASEEHLGGKRVTVFPEWGTVYVCVNGEVLFALFDSNRAHAKQILAALP